MGYLEDVSRAAIWGEKIPDPPEWVEWKHEMRGRTHCEDCLKLHDGWFWKEKAPKEPQHMFCHCSTRPIPYSQVLRDATANAAYSKFNPYLFDPENFYKHTKERLFKGWGYTVEDSEWLQKQCEEQGREKYVAGEYELGRKDEQGQRIDIRVEIPRRDKEGTASFVTGWMVRPDGHIQLNTPYARK